MEDKKEEIQNNTSKYHLIKVKTNKGVDAFIVDKEFDKEFYLRFELQIKDNIMIFICKEYKKASKFPTLFKIKDDNIIDKNFIHNHSGNANECSKYIFKSNIKDNIKATRNIFNISAQKIFINELTKNDLKNIPNFSTIKIYIYIER